MAEKKYYWLKLQNDFFKRHDIRIIESMPNGKDYILFYLKMLVESVSHEGNLRFSETIPYNEDMLATITNTNVDIVRSALKVFTELNMIDVLEDSTIFMAEVQKMIGFETDWAKKKREYRRQKEDNVLAMSSQCPIDVRQEIEIDIEIDKDNKKESKRFHKPSFDELQDYITKNGFNVDAQIFIDYYDSNGWKVGKNSMKDWKATVRRWNKTHISKADVKTKTSENGFNGIEKHNYDFNEIERKLANG